MKKILLSLITLQCGVTLATSVQAQTVFQCTTQNHKVIKAVDAGKNIQYSFGKSTATPELALSIPRNRVTTSQWTGIGRDEGYSIQIPNGNTTYEVFHTFDKITRQKSAGVNVMQKDQLLATVNCDPSKPMINKLQGIKLRSEF
ncbi:hypothetical protein [Acinetobacter ursingii]|uniref:hypothetical protein n=1 Tax=Acinetobacter ursingii TaxID=108980 RepID=UPI00370CA206